MVRRYQQRQGGRQIDVTSVDRPPKEAKIIAPGVNPGSVSSMDELQGSDRKGFALNYGIFLSLLRS